MSRSALCFAFVAACAAAAQAQQDQPADDQPAWSISTMLVKDVGPVEHFVYRETEATLDTMGEALEEIWRPMIETLESGAININAAPIFVYKDMTGGPDEPFTLQTGFPVVEASETPTGASRAALPGFHAATFYYTGPISTLGQGYGEAFTQLSQTGLQPTGQNREVYLFWEGDASPNNVVEIQIGIEAD